MSYFIERLLSEFACSSPKDDLAEECLAANEAILKFRGTGEGVPEAVSDLAQTDISAGDVRALATALRSFVTSQPEHRSVGSAIWAMSALDDPRLIPFYIEQIRLHYAARREHPVGQADYALCRLGHDVPFNYWSEERTTEDYWLAVEQFLAHHPET